MTSNDDAALAHADHVETMSYCALPVVPERSLPEGVSPDRARAIQLLRTKWVNSTVLHYYFFDRVSDSSTVTFTDGTTRTVTWVGPEPQRAAVRNAFKTWQDLGIGLTFREVTDRSEAEVRIGFMAGDGSWSYVGRDVLEQPVNERTMNFGWSLTTPYGFTTALHEIGHTIGMPHEHQNPFSGIVWDEEAVYRSLGGPPNNWPRQTTFHNILRKLDPRDVNGSPWDPASAMHYGFPAGLILEPAEFAAGIDPPGTLSVLDKEYVRKWYPPAGPQRPPLLTPFQSVPLGLKAGEQADFTITPTATRTYKISTFGASDTVMVLFEDDGGRLRYVAGDDDSGDDRNSLLSVKLFQGRNYVVRIRLYYSGASGQTAVMYW